MSTRILREQHQGRTRLIFAHGKDRFENWLVPSRQLWSGTTDEEPQRQSLDQRRRIQCSLNYQRPGRYGFLADWPITERTPLYYAAVNSVESVRAGSIPPEAARNALIVFLEEADILAEGQIAS
jgi:hypothetical protein